MHTDTPAEEENVFEGQGVLTLLPETPTKDPEGAKLQEDEQNTAEKLPTEQLT